MAISEDDWILMHRVAEYFETTRKVVDPKSKYKPKRNDSRSVNDTAVHFNISRSKVMKMLITMGAVTTPVSKQAQELRRSGMSVKDIAESLGVSVATVSSNLPYEEEIHGSDSVSDHALAMRGYRAYERQQRERQVQKKEKIHMKDIVDDKNKTGKKDINDTIYLKDKKKGQYSQESPDAWKKDLDSKMSFTETDTRRKRITYELLKELGVFDLAKAELNASGIQVQDIMDDRKKLREKLENTGSLTEDEILELGEFPGALYDRNPYDLEEIYGEELPYEPREMIRLHLELDASFTENEKHILHQYGGMEGETISRDILVSDDLPLYALHYVIQRAFGWQNSHLHRFYLPEKSLKKLTESVEQWTDQVGVIFRSPLMDEYAEFWADDYNGGSFKNWLRKKYTGPCMSQCRDEGLIACRDDIKHIDLDREYYVEYGNYGNYGYYENIKDCEDGIDRKGTEYSDDGAREAIPLRCRLVYGRNGEKYAPPKADKYVHNYRVEVMKFRDIPVSLLNQVFEREAFDILERLPIGQVLAVRNMHCADDYQEGHYVSTYQEMLDDGMDEEIEEILESGFDSPMQQPYVYTFTDELLYQYDFGDDWKIRITGSLNCTDLVDSGKITQDMLDKSNIKARVTYRPVLLARDGEMLIDDVGGNRGFVEFINAINTMKRGQRDENGMTRTQLKEWARSQGWHKDNSTDFNLI